MSFKRVKNDEMVVKMNDFGLLVDEFIRTCLRPNDNISGDWINENLRRWWPTLEGYYQRHIMTAIEVAILLDEPPRGNRGELHHREMWKKIVADLRPARSPFTVKYVCSKCKHGNIKLWRESHVMANQIELMCAACLAPGIVVDDDGLWQEPPYKSKDAYGNEIPGPRTDQVKGRVPAVPVDDTYWGYSSVPSQDVEWWKKLPTYHK